MNYRRRPFLCTTLYRNPMQASNFGGTFDQLFLWISLWNFHRRCVSTCSIPWCKKVKNDQKLKSRGGGSCLIKAGPLEAILVIFSRRAFCLKALGNKMKNGTTFVRMRSGDHLRDANMSKTAPRSVEFNSIIICDRQKRFSQNERRRADLQNFASDFLIFAYGFICSYDLSKFSDDFTAFFRFWTTITKSLGKN